MDAGSQHTTFVDMNDHQIDVMEWGRIRSGLTGEQRQIRATALLDDEGEQVFVVTIWMGIVQPGTDPWETGVINAAGRRLRFRVATWPHRAAAAEGHDRAVAHVIAHYSYKEPGQPKPPSRRAASPVHVGRDDDSDLHGE